jgi:hypothetical protein
MYPISFQQTKSCSWYELTPCSLDKEGW